MKKIISPFLHLAVFGLILALWLPILKSYNLISPPMGADFLQFPTFVAQLKNDLKIPPLSWKYIWYGGSPSVFDNAWLHFYLTLPLTNFLSVIDASRIYLTLTMVAQALFSYLLFFEISGSILVSAALTFGLISSVDFYIGLFDGGTATFTATRMFLPLTLWLLLKYFNSKKKKFLLLAGLMVGLSALGHAGSFLILSLAPAALFLITRIDETKLISFSRRKEMVIFVATSFFIGLVTLYPIVYLMLDYKKNGVAWAQVGFETKIQSDAIIGLFSSANPYLWGLFFLFGVLLVFKRKLKEAFKALPFLTILIYISFSCFLLFIGRHPLSQALGPGRFWWISSLAIAGLIAVFWRIIFPKIEGQSWFSKSKGVFLTLIIFMPIFLSLTLPSFKKNFEDHLSQNGYPSNAMPAAIRGDKEEVKKVMVPPWLDTETKDYRYYEITPGIQTWWNSVFSLPLIKGYYGIMTSKVNDWIYWVDQTILGEYVWHFNISEVIAKQHALFLIDWYAIRYLDIYGLPLADYLKNDPGVVEFEAVLNKENSEPLYPMKFFDNLTSPIIKATNVPSVLLVGSTVAYDTFLKLLATENLNSRYLVPIHGPEYIEDLAKMNLDDFDAIILYSYQYKNEKDFNVRPRASWKKIEDWVKKGGKLFIETGGEVIESDSSLLSFKKLDQLPAVFPIEKTKRENLGGNWALSFGDSPMIKGIDFSQFSKLAYEEAPWKLSYASGDLRSWAKPVLSQGDKIILAQGKLGNGQVIWSGLNLPYHFIYYLNTEEAKFFKNLLSEMVPLQKEEDLNGVNVQRSDNEHVQVSGKGFRGVLFKENYWEGWGSKLLLPKKADLSVYRAGPYFMYVRVPEGTTGDLKVNITYNGNKIGWVLFILSFLTILWTIIYFFLEEKIIKRRQMKNLKSDKIAWLGKEDE
ncbi:MAG: hypothetical protein M1575_03085 [Patescibacteria group bacterium]|nr:hypothetical protein [Patescibacteria group bacterium]MCL5095687.1 hypothetical protein [Patescibacteria group bacterium]